MSNNNEQERVMATSAVLSAASHHLFQGCRAVFDAYMRCRLTIDRDGPIPAEHCADLARQVIACGNDTFKGIAGSPCADAFRRLWRCLDNNDQVFFVVDGLTYTNHHYAPSLESHIL